MLQTNIKNILFFTLRPLRLCGEKEDPSHGFTLIELVVVLFIIGLIAGMSIPRIANLESVKMRNTARRMASEIGYVYQSAIVKKTNFRICYDVIGHAYWTEERSGDEYVKTSDTLLPPHTLADGIYFRKVQIMDREADEDENVCLYFTPYGYVEDAVIQIENEQRSAGYTLTTDTMTGKAILSEGFEE